MKNKNKEIKIIMYVMIGIIFISAFYKGNYALQTVGEVADVVIDAGHGMPDGGAVGKSGVLESEINLKVAKYLKSALEEKGIKVIMTREDENALYTDENASVRNKKREDMRKREEIINYSRASMAISIHMNYFGIEKYSGPQLFCPSDNEKAYEISKMIKNSLLKNIGEHCNREIKKVDGGIYLLKKAKIPIVLAECGFLSNSEEEKLLITDKYCKQMGNALAEGIINYLKSKE